METLRSLLGDKAAPQHKAQLLQLADDLELLEQQLQVWGEARSRFSELLEAVDQLTRVSASLQRGVLETRMVPVGPLFGRFKRSVRDIANELGKRVSLELCGEKTELDKRMIDEIGDPLNHLIRNSIDHGIESAAARTAAGKPAVATVRLTASHRGNNVFITVEDDGGGIDGERVRQTAVKRGLLSQATAETLAESELHELIWQPGFSTASKISDISGRGVGMDIVRTKIIGLNGSIDVDSRRGEGTCFTIRLPLTLTIARCMLFRVDEGVFGVPIENVREIVSAQGLRSVATGGRTLADIRGEMLPLVSIHDLFHWSGSARSREADAVIVLQSGHRLLGLRAETLLGGQDVVIKPLDENFLHVRGLGGAACSAMARSVSCSTPPPASTWPSRIRRPAATQRLDSHRFRHEQPAARPVSHRLRAAAGLASEALSKWLGRPVSITIQQVEAMPLEEATGLLGEQEGTICGCAMEIRGSLQGILVVLSDDDAGLALAAMLLGREPSAGDRWGELEKSAVVETTNIIGRAYVNAMAKSTAATTAAMPSPPGSSATLLPR